MMGSRKFGPIVGLAAVSVVASLLLIICAAAPIHPHSAGAQAGMEKKPVSPERLAAPRPRYEVRKTAAPPTIDGNVEPGEWSAAGPAISFIFPWDVQTGAKQKTSCRLLWDDRNLYVAYECEDSDVTARVRGRDEFVYRDDTVELFLNVRPAQNAAYYCIETNALGTVMDYICVDAQFYVRRLNLEDVKIGIQVDGTLNESGDADRGWRLEMAVPWRNFSDMAKPPQAGTIFTANLNRWDGIEPNRRLSVWADSKIDWPHPHSPQNFGDLVFR
jgi:hypothetical protein